MYLCTDTEKDEQFALKEIKRSLIRNFYGGSNSTSNSGSQELEILKQLVHTNIVKLHEIIDDPKSENLYLVMDYLPGGTLAEKLKESKTGLKEEEVRKLFQ